MGPLLGGDAQFRPQTQLTAVGEARRGVDHDDGGVDRLRETIHSCDVPGENRLGVPGRPPGDVIDGFLQIRHDPHGQVKAAVLGGPVLVGGRDQQLPATGPPR